MNSSKLMKFVDWKSVALFCALVTAGVVARVAYQHIPNFAPVAALALFAGYMFANRAIAFCVPIAIMLISDRLVEAGGYDWPLMLTVYGLLAAPVFVAGYLKKSLDFGSSKIGRVGSSVLTVGACSLGASVLFFVGTNAMVWANSSLYPRTVEGFASCYAAAIPFFQYTLSGDMIFSLVFFGTYAVVVAAKQSMVRNAAFSS